MYLCVFVCFTTINICKRNRKNKGKSQKKNCKIIKKKKIYNCCQSIVAVCRYWQIILAKNWSRKLKNPLKLGLKYAKRETSRSMWKNKPKQN